jgi:hypothetical protein
MHAATTGGGDTAAAGTAFGRKTNTQTNRHTARARCLSLYGIWFDATGAGKGKRKQERNAGGE